MLGAVIGDIAGSRFEFYNYRKKDFNLFSPKCSFTDDSVMSLAVAQAILESEGLADLSANATRCMQMLGRAYPNAGYGGRFIHWLFDNDPQPYNSLGNGAAMRVSACGFAASSLEEALDMAYYVTVVSHDHPEGVKGAEATAACIYLARTGSTIEEILDFVDQYYYALDFTLDSIRKTYRFDVTCQGSVPQAITAFLESDSFEDAIRNAVSIGGDSDTIAAIAGSIAEAYYGIPDDLRAKALTYLDSRLTSILTAFESKYPAPSAK